MIRCLATWTHERDEATQRQVLITNSRLVTVFSQRWLAEVDLGFSLRDLLSFISLSFSSELLVWNRAGNLGWRSLTYILEVCGSNLGQASRRIPEQKAYFGTYNGPSYNCRITALIPGQFMREFLWTEVCFTSVSCSPSDFLPSVAALSRAIWPYSDKRKADSMNKRPSW